MRDERHEAAANFEYNRQLRSGEWKFIEQLNKLVHFYRYTHTHTLTECTKYREEFSSMLQSKVTKEKLPKVLPVSI